MLVSIVIPMYNEEKIAAESAKELCAYMDSHFEQYEVIVSDDGSTDKTSDVIKELTKSLPNLRLIGYPDNRGKGSAIREGILSSKGDIVVYTDCDLAYGTGIISDIVNKLKDDKSDIVIGSRNISADGYEGYTPLRRLASKTYIKVLGFAAGFEHSDSQCGIKCFKGDIARKIFSKCKINGFAFDLEALMIAKRMKLKVTEQPAKIINHRESTSKVHLVKDTIKMLRDIRNIKKSIKSMSF